MDILGWLWWVAAGLASGLLSLLWFLVSGWVATFLQVAVLVIIVFAMKYGWQRAPLELWRRARSAGRFIWSWVRSSEGAVETRIEEREVVRIIRVKEFGDINVSTALSLLVLVGLAMLSAG